MTGSVSKVRAQSVRGFSIREFCFSKSPESQYFCHRDRDPQIWLLLRKFRDRSSRIGLLYQSYRSHQGNLSARDGIFHISSPALHVRHRHVEAVDGPAQILPRHVGLPRRPPARRRQAVQLRVVRFRNRLTPVAKFHHSLQVVIEAFTVVSVDRWLVHK